MKLSYNKVFDRYTMSFSDKLAESSYSLYRTLRLQLAKIFPLSEHEKYRFDDDLFSKEEAADMPQGFDYIEKKDVDSFVKLDYIDLYDYLPKEDLPKFIKELKKCVRRNKIAPFGAFRSREDIDKIDNFGRYYDGQAFTHILSVQFRKNEKLQQSCSDLSVSLRNLSATFLLVQYRVYITKEFNTKSIDHDDVKAFRHQFYKKGSVSSRSLEGISKRIKETKVQIDNILKLLNDAAEYRSSESNIKLQWIMMIVTILSLFVALYSIKNGDVINEIKNLIEWIKTHSGLKVSNL